MSSPTDPKQPRTKRQIPAKPNLFNIKDPEIRTALDDLWSGWQLRNGITGNGDQAFITKADLDAMIAKRIAPVPVQDGGSTTIINSGGTTVPQVTYLVRKDFPDSPISHENNGWAADVTVTSGPGSIVAGHFHAYSENVHYGGCWGLAIESTLTNNKNGPGIVDTQCFGIESSCNIFHSQSKALRHAGALIVFKNRLDVEITPKSVAGVPMPPNSTLPIGSSYNKNTSAIYIDAGGGRNRGYQSHLNNIYGSPYIPCGFQRGIYFSTESLDESANGAHDAVGIDMSALGSKGIPIQNGGTGPPEGDTSGTGVGARYSQRMKAAIALAPWMLIRFDENPNGQIGMRYDDINGMVSFVTRARHGSDGQFAAGIQVENGMYMASYAPTGSYGAYLNLAAPQPPAIFKCYSHGRTNPPNGYANPAYPGMLTLPHSWITIDVDNHYYSIPIWSQ